jgi:Ran GTPase-activating protein (RanGAP) involved in mRNA processing and transport
LKGHAPIVLPDRNDSGTDTEYDGSGDDGDGGASRGVATMSLTKIKPSISRNDDSARVSALDLSKNSIGDRGCVALAKMLASNQSVKAVSLRSNIFGCKGFAAIFRALTPSPAAIRRAEAVAAAAVEQTDARSAFLTQHDDDDDDNDASDGGGNGRNVRVEEEDEFVAEKQRIERRNVNIVSLNLSSVRDDKRHGQMFIGGNGEDYTTSTLRGNHLQRRKWLQKRGWLSSDAENEGDDNGEGDGKTSDAANPAASIGGGLGASSAMVALSRMLAFNKTLLYLNLSNVGLGLVPGAIEVVARGLRRNDTLRHLDLSSNSLYFKDIRHITAALLSPAPRRAETVIADDGEFSRFPIDGYDTDDGDNAAAIAGGGLLGCLQRLSLRDNYLGSSGAACVAALLAESTKLEHLDLSRNGITSVGFALITDSICERESVILSSLVMAGNPLNITTIDVKPRKRKTKRKPSFAKADSFVYGSASMSRSASLAISSRASSSLRSRHNSVASKKQDGSNASSGRASFSGRGSLSSGRASLSMQGSSMALENTLDFTVSIVEADEMSSSDDELPAISALGELSDATEEDSADFSSEDSDTESGSDWSGSGSEYSYTGSEYSDEDDAELRNTFSMNTADVSDLTHAAARRRHRERQQETLKRLGQRDVLASQAADEEADAVDYLARAIAPRVYLKQLMYYNAPGDDDDDGMPSVSVPSATHTSSSSSSHYISASSYTNGPQLAVTQPITSQLPVYFSPRLKNRPAMAWRHLDVSNCALGDAFLAQAFDCVLLKQSRDDQAFTHLNFSNNRMTPRGAGVVSRYLAHTDVLRSLNVSRNYLDDAAGVDVCKHIARAGSELAFVDISHNRVAANTARTLLRVMRTTELAVRVNVEGTRVSYGALARIRERIDQLADPAGAVLGRAAARQITKLASDATELPSLRAQCDEQRDLLASLEAEYRRLAAAEPIFEAAEVVTTDGVVASLKATHTRSDHQAQRRIDLDRETRERERSWKAQCEERRRQRRQLENERLQVDVSIQRAHTDNAVKLREAEREEAEQRKAEKQESDQRDWLEAKERECTAAVDDTRLFLRFLEMVAAVPATKLKKKSRATAAGAAPVFDAVAALLSGAPSPAPSSAAPAADEEKGEAAKEPTIIPYNAKEFAASQKMAQERAAAAVAKTATAAVAEAASPQLAQRDASIRRARSGRATRGKARRKGKPPGSVYVREKTVKS